MEHRSSGTPPRQGRTIPLDAEPSPKGNVQIGVVGGEVLAIVVNAEDAAACQIQGMPLYLSHFATCPNASDHRKAKS